MPTEFDRLREEEAPEPATSVEVESIGETDYEYADERGEVLGPLPAEGMDDDLRAGLEAMYGSAFPYLDNDQPADEKWVAWAQQLWQKFEPGVRNRLYLVERNRLFYKGIQWLSAKAGQRWEVPPKPRDAARVTYNMIQPALDQRTQIVAEQRPGFKTRPATQDPQDVKKAEARQIALEAQWDKQEMDKITRACEHHAGTDGVVFVELFWDPDRGPKIPDERGAEVRAGDVGRRIVKIEQVRVSAEATSTQSPMCWVLRDDMPLMEAVRRYGYDVAQKAPSDGQQADDMSIEKFQVKHGYLLPKDDELKENDATTSRYTVYCEPSDYLPNGLRLLVVGEKVLYVGPLETSRVPMVRWTDGGSDPAFLPTPNMDDWVEHQMRVNAVLSKWVENVRVNSTPRFLAKRNSLVGETLLGGTTGVLEVRGLGELSQLVHEVSGMSLAPDAKELLALEIRNFENKSGWNDTSRGQYSSDMSGRAILAIREQLERIFAPVVMAAAQAMTEWADITVEFMRYGYDMPRMLGIQGSGRPDLAREFSAEDFDAEIDVFIDPETLMPLPRALRLAQLEDLFAKGLITPFQFLRRHPFAYIREMDHPDEVQAARAKRVVEALKQGQWLPILWMDNEMIHKDVLEREVLLNDDADPQVRSMAYMRWLRLDQQMFMKMQGSLPQQGAPAPPADNKPSGPAGNLLPAGQQPFAGTSPGIAAGTFNTAGAQTDERRNARAFDARQRAQGSP